jgi:hypothetical protein
MVGLDDLDVDPVTQHPGGRVQQLETEVHADAHVGREDDADLCPGI